MDKVLDRGAENIGRHLQRSWNSASIIYSEELVV
jgi:hypothetical protein